MEKVYKTAIYLRLSRDDEREKESVSISNQRNMLMNFIESRNDLQFSAEYSDDGYSGYDFERPQFQKMISDAKEGKIDLILVKSISIPSSSFL